MKEEYPILINGDWCAGAYVRPVLNPYDGNRVADVHRADRRQVALAVAAATAGFETMRRLPSYRRAEILRRTAQTLRENADELARIITLESGKPIREARVEVERGATTFALAAEEALRITGELLPLDINEIAGDRLGIVARFPLGVVSAITPFNFPLNLVAHKVAPALAAGNAVVLKPSSSTPITALRLGEILLDAGLPREAVQITPSSPADAEPLLSDPAIKMVTFTGSPAVGWDLKSRCGKARICLELGGNAAAIVEPDADLSHAVKRCVAGGYAFAGQICISLQRIFLHEQIAERFTAQFLQSVQSLRAGDPLDDATQIGPMITEAAAIQTEERVNQAVQSGARLLCGGRRRGNFYEPTVLENVPAQLPVADQEIFAPVTVIQRYSDFDQAIEEVNRSEFGLQAGLFSSNIRKILRAYNRIEVGGLIINDVPTYRVDNYPYGGVKASGLGREGVRYAVEEMTERRILVLQNER
jgi:glyceraldehyde-3-phosphate dehydrogenase (NADP+)